MNSHTEIRRVTYPDGTLLSEMPMVNGRAHGIFKKYHANGQIETEMPVENGLQHGVTKRWAPDGRFLGEYSMEYGTGVVKDWDNNGHIISEISFVRGILSGRQRSWDETGEPGATLYWIRGKRVSSKKYFEECKSDAELPKYHHEK